MYKKLFYLLSVISTIIISILTVDSLEKIWIIPVAFVSSLIIILAVFFIILSIITSTIKKDRVYETHSKFFYRIFVHCGELVCNFCRVKVKVEGLEKVPTDSKFLFVQNHRSNLDPVIAFVVLKKFRTAIISKPKNFNIIYLGKLMRRCHFIPINRNNPREGIKSINRAVELVKEKDTSIIVYPEGTRNRHDNNVLPFKNGTFKIAQKTNIPIVIASIEGTEKIKHRSPWRSTKVLFKFIETVNPSDFNSTTEMASYAENAIAKDLGVKVYSEEDVVRLNLTNDTNVDVKLMENLNKNITTHENEQETK